MDDMFGCFVMDCFFFNDTATTEIYTLSLHDALPISGRARSRHELEGKLRSRGVPEEVASRLLDRRSEEHTSELQSHLNLVCRLLLEKKKQKIRLRIATQPQQRDP